MNPRTRALFGAFVMAPLLACATTGGEAGDSPTADALGDANSATLVPETAPTRAIVLANADLFSGINELHYTFLRGLFADRALDDVKVFYLSPDDASDVITPVRSKDGDRLTGKFSVRFAAEIAAGRLVRTRAAIETNWARDFFPMTLKDPSGAKKAVRFDYRVMPDTGPAGESAARALGFEVSKSNLSLEGGNIMVDDDGTLFTTTEIVARNTAQTKPEIEAELKRALGVKSIEWLERLPGESTGHVDIMAKVVGSKQVVVGASDGVCSEDNAATCRQRVGALDAAAKAFERRGYRVTRVMNADSAGDSRALTYANSLLVNGTAFVPMYFDPAIADDLVLTMQDTVPVKTIINECKALNPFPGTTDLAADLVARERARCAIEGVVKAAEGTDSPISYLEYGLQIAKRDAEAKRTYESLGLRVVQVPSAAMINFGGSVHCVTMQIPK